MRNFDLLRRLLILSSALAWHDPARLTPTSRPPELLVVNQTDHTVSFIDPTHSEPPATFDEEATTGHEIALSPDGRTAFVPIYGNSGVGKPGTDGRTLEVIDVSSHKLIHTVDFNHGVRPHCAVYDRKRKVLYVTTELDQTVTIVDPVTYAIVGSIPTGQMQSHMLTLSHDGRFGYTANVGPGTVSVLDLNTRRTIGIIPISSNTQRISISNDDRFVFTADQTKPQLAVIDTTTRTLAPAIPLPGIAYGTALTSDGHWLLAAMRSLGGVALIDARTHTFVRLLQTGGVPTEILVRPDGKFAYVSCGKNVVSIDLDTMKVAETLHAGTGADGMAWAN